MNSHPEDQFDELIERSSLGTLAARQLRERTPPVQADLVDLHSKVLRSGGDDDTAQSRLRVDPLIDAALAGDRTAIDRLLTAIGPLVVRYCRARIPKQESSFASADALAQEVCLAVLTALPSYRDQGRPFLAFVYGIAAHKVAHWHPSPARDRSEPKPEVTDTAELAAGSEQRAQGDLTEQMVQLLLILPPKQREILLLTVVVGLSVEDTADAVGSTPVAVRVAKHRALARLREHYFAQNRADS